jgi:hypothetical protein
MTDADRAQQYYETARSLHRAGNNLAAAQQLARALAAAPSFAEDQSFLDFAANVLQMPVDEVLAELQGKRLKLPTSRPATIRAIEPSQGSLLLVRGFVVVFGIIGLIASIWAASLWLRYIRIGQNGVVTMATVVERNIETSTDTVTGQPQQVYFVTYQFSIAAQAYTGKTAVIQAIYESPTTPLEIIYDRFDPSISRLNGTTEQNRQLTINVLGTMLALVWVGLAAGMHVYGERRARSM